MNLYFGPPIVVPGVTVPCPDLSTFWYEGAGAVLPQRLVVYDGLSISMVLEDEEGGLGKASIVVGEDGTPGVQVEMVQEGVWDVVLTDYFSSDTSPCPDVVQSDPLSGSERIFFGAATGELNRLSRGGQELGTALTAFLRPNVIAPGGIGVSHLYQNVYLTVEGSTGGLVRITPVIDGELLTDEEIIFAVPSDGSTRLLERFEIPLSRKYDVAASEVSRAGIVGTWFTVELEVIDTFGCGRLEVGGLEVEYVILSQSIIGQTFTGESMVEPLLVQPTAWFLAGIGGELHRGDQGSDDAGTDIAVYLQTNDLAPAGVGGECLFQSVKVAVTRFNAVDWDLTVIPVVDGIALAGQTITLEGVANPVTKLLDVPLSQPYLVGGVEVSRYVPRGAWIAIRFTSDDAPDQEVTLEGVEVEYEVLTESLEAVD